jgi:3-methyladenine DNA glycosylase AlkC
MAKKFKDYYDKHCARLYAEKLLSLGFSFDAEGFLKYLEKELPDKEFLQRQDIFARAFTHYLTGSYKDDIALFLQILGDELQSPEGMFTFGWWLWPLGRYVEQYGANAPDVSIPFIYELTKRFTGEFAIRPLIAANPSETLKSMLAWSLDSNVHVRRLASEGLRTRLPWAKKSFAALEAFDLYKSILVNLKSDGEKFVQKSVGNNLNDLMKDFPEKAEAIIAEWEKDNPSKETLWIIRHGRRSLKK